MVLNETTNNWYLEPLKIDDFFAGAFLVCFGGFFVPLYIAVAYVMFKNDKEIIGFRFLFSAAIADIFILFNYSIWPGLTILFKSEIVAPWMRHWIQVRFSKNKIVFKDVFGLGLVFHVLSLHADCVVQICSDSFCILVSNSAKAYELQHLCSMLYLCFNSSSMYSTFYYEPSAYGMLSEDFQKYLTQGQSLFFFTFHLLMMIIPFIFYRLIIPCIFNSIVFIIGQIVITNGTGEGKWATWTVLLLFSANSAVNPLLLLTFSAIIRQKTVSLVLSSARFSATHINYSTVPGGLLLNESATPSPMDSRKCKTTIQLHERSTSAYRTTEYHMELLRQISEPILAQEF